MIWNSCNLSSAWIRQKVKCLWVERFVHASITEKVEAEMDRRREENGTYTREKILRDLEAQIKSMGGDL